MMKIIFALIISFVSLLNSSGSQKGNLQLNEKGRILKVPSEYSTIELAVKNSTDGDWIILAPGKYFENNIDINRAVTISSEWKITGDELKIEESIIDPRDSILFNIKADSVEISGLKIINGNHTLNITASAIIKNNHFIRNLDALSFESSGGGYAGYNTIENDRDDGLDLDIVRHGRNPGTDILIEHNTILNSKDDGIEIRLYPYTDQNINYTIRENKIIGSKNAGIQLISYDIFTGKIFRIHNNIIQGCKTGLGCMEGSNTVENLAGASKMDELVCFFNNTLLDNQMGATGGNNTIAINNLVVDNSLGGFKNFGRNSAVVNNLFYQNGKADLSGLNDSVIKEGNIFSVDPLLDKTSFIPAFKSPCSDAGRLKYEIDGKSILEISAKYISGSAPDIGAVEINSSPR